MKKSELLLAAGIIGTLHLIYLIFSLIFLIFFSFKDFYDFYDLFDGGTESVLLIWSLILSIVRVMIAVIFNWLGWAFKARWGALVAGIMYAVSIGIFSFGILRLSGVLLAMIFCFVVFAKNENTSEKNIIES